MICPNCGGEINKGIGRCESCGSGFTPEDIRKIENGIKGVYELTKGATEMERMIEKADTHLKLGNFDAALRSYRDVSYEFPKDYRGWLGEVNCRTKNFTNFSIGKIGVSAIQEVINNAIEVAPSGIRQEIRSKWEAYSSKCIQVENERLEYEAGERERIRLEKEQAEQAERKRIADEKAAREAEAERQRQIRLAEEEKQRQLRIAEEERKRLAAERAARNLRIRQLVCSLIVLGVEVAVFSLMLAFDFEAAINESLGGFIGVDVALLANALVVGIVDRIGKIKFGTYIATGVNAIFAIWIFVAALGSMEGFIITALALLFFGVIELGVIWLSYIISHAISELGTD